ncbi:MAG: long-chain fatty acid--CoA ligase [Ramlibacter sp.]
MDGLSAATRTLVPELLAFLAQDGCDDAAFDAMALRLFAHQYEHNEPLRRFCQRRGLTPRRVSSWRDIPAVPINAFKETTLSCEPVDACERVFMTSGTTRAEVKGRHHHPTIAVWDLSMRRNFAARFMRTAARIPMAILFPPETELGNSSLARYLTQAVREFGTADSAWYLTSAGMDLAGLRARLREAERSGQPLAVLGASYGFVHLLDAMAQDGESVRLPAGSRILDTGGYKRQSRELAPEDFYSELALRLGVPRMQCINMYGMTELSSQFYDEGNAVTPAVKRGPHWIRSRVVDPLTGREMRLGEQGVLVHCDLASFNSTTTILTEDVGVAVDGGFLLLGRAQGAQARGCSLAVAEFLGTT